MSKLTDTIRHPGFLLGTGLTLGAGVLLASSAKNPQMHLPSPSNSVVLRPVSLGNSVANGTLRQADQALVDVVQAVSPAVVNISYKIGANSGGTGTGFIYRADGWIVTNDHVVGDRTEVSVTMADGREFTGKVTRANDAMYDVAMIKIDARDLPTLAFADSDSIRPGQIAIAVGSPFGLESTVTIGHISATGRGQQAAQSGEGQRLYSGMIQTDAAMNPGNSGGPLLDIDGNVVGINSMIYSNQASMFGEAGGSVGIGFAIASKVAKPVADKLIATGKLERAFLGAQPISLAPYKAKELGIAGGAKLYLDARVKDSPAQASGMKTDDIITKIDDDVIKNELDVRADILKRDPGSIVTISYLRDGKPATVKVKLSTAPAQVKMPVQRQRQPMMKSNPFGFDNQDDQGSDLMDQAVPEGKVQLGATVNELDATVRGQFKVPGDVKGVVVMSINDGSLAKRVGLEIGDVITSLNGKPVSSIESLKQVLDTLKKGETFAIEAVRYVGGSKQLKQLTIKE